MSYCIITENDVSKWSDITGKKYHFPTRYLKYLQPDTKVIYYKGKLKHTSLRTQRLSDNPHYFGIATIGEISKASDGNWNAEIRDFRCFAKAVDFKKDGIYIEIIPSNRLSNYWRNGVRPIDENIYNKIIKLSET